MLTHQVGIRGVRPPRCCDPPRVGMFPVECKYWSWILLTSGPQGEHSAALHYSPVNHHEGDAINNTQSCRTLHDFSHCVAGPALLRQQLQQHSTAQHSKAQHSTLVGMLEQAVRCP